VGTPSSTSNPIGITTLNDTTFYFVNVTNTTTTCSAKDSFMVIGIPIPNIAVNDTTVCKGQMVKLVARPTNITNVDSLHPVYQWKYNGAVQSSVNDTLLPTLTGVYTVTVSIGSCTNSDVSTITLNPNPDPVPHQVNFCHEAGGIAVLDAGNTGSQFQWLIPTNDITQTIKATEEGTYKVIITNQFNCVSLDSIHLRNTCPPHVYVPNTFMPDCKDCGNTDFKIWGTNFTNLETFVFNRWGEIIFHSKGKENGWDGNYRGEPMPIGSYVWLITYDGVYEEFKGPYKDKGNITIIR
jgi:gliding motility-associated-like protein